MPRPCSICLNPQKVMIDSALVKGESVSKVATRFDVSRSAVGRHRKNCLKIQLQRAAARQALDSDSLLEDLITLRSSAVRLMTRAEAAESWQGATSALNSAHKVTETLARMIGALEPDRTQINVLSISGEAWPELRSKILAALAPHPEARAAVLLALGVEPSAPGLESGEVIEADFEALPPEDESRNGLTMQREQGPEEACQQVVSNPEGEDSDHDRR